MANINFELPIRGVSKSMENQPNLTSGYMNNVRPRDVLEKRIRIGQRPGLDKWSTDQIGESANPVVCLLLVSSIA